MGVKQWVRAMLVLSSLPSVASALGLGDIRLNSNLNAPLNAEIELVNATPEELGSLRAQLASRETFARYGLEWPAFLQSVTLVREKAADGREILRVRSREAITEPFVTLLVDANWGRGRLVREYTVLLDPPVFSPNQTPAAPIAQPVSGATRSGTVERPVAQQPPSDGTSVPVEPTASEDTYQVRRGDTLSAIARQLATGRSASTEQLMVGLYQGNSSAFLGSMDRLRAGAVLRVPDEAALAAVSRASAQIEVQRQRAAWRARTATAATSAPGAEGRLRLVAPTESSSSGSASGDAEVAALRSRLTQLESDLSASRRLLELRNSELAELQRKLAAATGAPAPTPAPTPALTPPPPEAVTAAVPPSEPPVVAATPPTDDATVAAPAPAETPPVAPPTVRRPVAAVEPPVEEPSFFAGIIDAVKEFWWLPVGLLAVIGGLFGYRKWQSGRAADLDDTFVGYDNAAPSEMTMPRVPSDTAKLRRPNIASPAERTGVVVEESGEYEAPRLDAQRAEAAQTIAAEDTFSGETGINLDQGDPLAEADFHMAYGLYDQAADLVRLAVAREPERRDLQLKLAEVYFVWGNKEEFLNAARVLQKTQAEGAPGEWEKVVIMGRQIAPEDPLFASASVRAAGAAGAAVDLRLDGGDGPIDFDVFGDGTGTGSTVEKPRLTTTDLDIGASLGDNDATGERLSVDTAEINMGADAPTQVLDAGGATTREMSPRFAATGTRQDLDADLGIDLGAATSPDISDAPTVEQPSLRAGSPTIRAKLDAARRVSAVEETAEVPIDDLGLDLGDAPGLDAPDAGEAADAPTLVARMDDDSQRLMALAAKGSDASQQGQDTGATSMIAAIDLSQFDETGTHQVNGGSLDLDIGSPTMTDLKPPKLAADAGSEDLTLPSLEPVTISEVGTKLDLARAYMDMGDPDGARNILNEVLHEGSVSQKQEAQRLLESLPG